MRKQRRTMAACASAVIFSLSTAADEIPAAGKPILAVSKIFLLENHLHEDISLLTPETADIGTDFHVSRDLKRPCVFELLRGRTLIEAIDFTKLTGEYAIGANGHYLLLRFEGTEGGEADCDISANRCSDGLELNLTAGELKVALRDMRFIFANVCTPAEPPL